MEPSLRPPQREFDAFLPVGYTDALGRVHRHAILRKMRGHEEALLYDAGLSAGRLVTELIQSCLVRLGDLSSVDGDAAVQLYTADRNYLLLELRRITLGNHLHAAYRCPGCGGTVSLIEDLSQVPVRRLEQGQALVDQVIELEDGYEDTTGTLHTRLTLTLPRGVDEEFVAPMAARDPLKAQDALLLRCIKNFGSLPRAALEAYGVKILRDLTLSDRQRIYQALNGQTPGVDFQRTIECSQCGVSFKGVLDISNFFVLS